MKQSMILTLLISISISVHNHTVYHFIPEYESYSEKFKQKAEPNNTLQMTQYGTGIELCKAKNLRQACRFYIYLHQPIQAKYTVLFTSGMHGNQLIGPTSLYYLYDILKPKDIKIIYFPICNPSGYDLKQRKTFPNGLDLNRDFPIDNNLQCYEGSSTRILDQIFRKYKIDMTINLHNGGDEIGWNWGTYYHQKFSHTDQYDIYKSIGEMLKLIGGQNKRLSIQPFKIGTMDQVIYPAKGTLDDWAYGASWTQSVPHKCQNYQYEPYPKQMHQGLVFLFELGMHNATEGKLGTSQGIDQPSDSESTNNGYITRTIRMMRALLSVVSPTAIAQVDNNILLIRISGCQSVITHKLQLLKINENNESFTVNLETQLKFATVPSSFIHLAAIDVKKQEIQKYTQLFLNYSFQCDKEWNGVGRSFLSRTRVLESAVNLSKLDNGTPKKQFVLINGKSVYSQINIWYLLLIPLLLLIFIVVFVIRRKKQSKANQKKKIQKYDNENEMVESEFGQQSERSQNVQNGNQYTATANQLKD